MIPEAYIHSFTGILISQVPHSMEDGIPKRREVGENKHPTALGDFITSVKNATVAYRRLHEIHPLLKGQLLSLVELEAIFALAESLSVDLAGGRKLPFITGLQKESLRDRLLYSTAEVVALPEDVMQIFEKLRFLEKRFQNTPKSASALPDLPNPTDKGV